MSDPTTPDTTGMDTLAQVYIKIRNRVNELTRAYETEYENLKGQQEIVANAMKEKMLALGVTSVRTNEGTAILSTSTRYFTTDWEAFKTFVKDHDALDLFEKRIHQRNMKQFIDENPTELPQGLNAETEYTVSVRKPTK